VRKLSSQMRDTSLRPAQRKTVTGGAGQPVKQGVKIGPAKRPATGGILPPVRTPAGKAAAGKMSQMGFKAGRVYPKGKK